MKAFMLLLYVVLAVMMVASARPPRLVLSHGHLGKRVLRSPRGAEQAASLGRPMVRVLAVTPWPGMKTVKLAWDNVTGTTAHVTGLEGSTNLAGWYPVDEWPYATHVLVSLTNRPPWEFYRAYNR